MRFEDANIEDVSALVSALTKHIDGVQGPIWYRGQADKDWKLTPKLLRSLGTRPESYYMNRFKQDAALIANPMPQNSFEWLFLMQHYGAPTRLLDWTESPLVALYFAASELAETEGALWVLLPHALNMRSMYSPDYEFEVPSFEDEHLKPYKPESIAQESKTRLIPMAAIAPRNSTRMQAQRGVFTVNHRDDKPLEESLNGTPVDYVWRYLISPNAKSTIIRELQMLGVNRFQLFPDLDSVTKSL